MKISVAVSLSLSQNGKRYCKISGEQRLKLSNWTLPDPLLLLRKGFFSCPPCHLLFHLHKVSCRRWREKYFCWNQIILSLKMSLTQGCILGAGWKDAVPRRFQSVLLCSPRWRNWGTQNKEQQVLVVKVSELGWIIPQFYHSHEPTSNPSVNELLLSLGPRYSCEFFLYLF